jgi:uncharacterized protein
MKGGCTIRVQVKPNARESRLEPPEADGPWLARLKSPPVEGKANKELISLVAKHFGCPRSAVEITAGLKGRLKRVRIAPDK